MPRDTGGLGSSPFARRYWGNRCYFLFLRVLRCFSSPRSPPGLSGVTGSLPPGCPIRRSRGLWVFAPRPGFSQLVTSFFASESQGIPHAPFFRSVISFYTTLRRIVVFAFLVSHHTRRITACLALVCSTRLLIFSLGYMTYPLGTCPLPSCHCALPCGE